MTEQLSFDVHTYTFKPGLEGDVHIENVSTLPGRGGWSSMFDARLPGAELKQLVKTAAPQPMVGISLLVVDEFGADVPRVLLGKRRGSHGVGQYAGPGGHLENGESYEDAAWRELREECGHSLTVAAPKFLCVTNLRNYLPRHYTDIGMVLRFQGGVPENTEPDKCDGWGWHRIDQLPTPRFGGVDNLVIAYQTGQTYFPHA